MLFKINTGKLEGNVSKEIIDTLCPNNYILSICFYTHSDIPDEFLFISGNNHLGLQIFQKNLKNQKYEFKRKMKFYSNFANIKILIKSKFLFVAL